MKKLFLIFTLTILFKNGSAQYFIPLFNPTIDTMFNCNLLIADYSNYYLYVFAGDSSLTNRIYAYRDNNIEMVNGYTNSVFFRAGCITDSGFVACVNQDNELHSIDSLTIENCFYGFCNVSQVDAMVSRNDTIYYDDNIASDEWVVANTPGGVSLLLGEATGGGGNVTDLEFYNGHLYACGTFTAMNGNTACKYICWWDGSIWHPVNQTGITWGLTPGIQAMELYDNNLIGGGGIDLVNGIPSHYWALFNGSSWQPIKGIKFGGGPFPEYHGKIYFFGTLLNYNNNSYGMGELIDDSIKYNYNMSTINTLTGSVFKDTLFIGGKFDHVGYVPCHNIVKFVDNSFSSFAPVGTKWWYNSSDTAYKYYEVARDTFIMHTANYCGYNCRKITGEQHEHDSTIMQLQQLYVFGDTNRVMYYNSYRGRFVPLYNFNVSTGDTLTYYTPQPQTASDTTFRVVMDSITQLNIQGTNYKRVWSTPLDGWSFGNDGYVQLIGGMGSMLPQPINYYNTEGPLRCYEDTSVFYHYLVNINCDQLDTLTGVEELIVNSYQLTVSNINETSILVNILTTRSTSAELLIYNIQGQLVTTKNISLRAGENHFTEPTPYSQGMYLLQVRTKSEVRNVKFVRE